MSASATHRPVRPGPRHGPLPSRRAPGARPGAVDAFTVRAMATWRGLGAAAMSRSSGRSARWLDALEARVAALGTASVETRHAALRALAERLGRRDRDATLRDEALAHAIGAARRTLGLTAHEAQRLAARELLDGRFVEMDTGEGKTLATALAAASAALDGTPVHVLTANDYLAERDAARLDPFYRALGLRGACVLPSMDEAARRSAYAASIVHVTGKQVAFDWLRDALAGHDRAHALAARLGALACPGAATRTPPLTRGLCLALVDEADSLMVDEARTPLVLAAPRAPDPAVERECTVSLGLARLLHEGIHFRLLRTRREVVLTEDGEASLDRLTARISGVWRATRYRDERVRQALAALHLWTRDRDYVVREGRVELVDEQSGRSLPDRRLQQGLHRLIELVERCAPTADNEIVASLPFQRFFLRYVRLAGTSGTLAEVRAELAGIYGVRVSRVAPRHRSVRRQQPTLVFATRAAQLDALVREVRETRGAGRPVLIGTRSVEQSSGVGARLAAHGIPHRVMNARQDAEEAAIVAAAGTSGQVTVATNMAGRGTDIPVPPDAVAAGGLHVISLAFNDARRIDRQLAGRAARQGDPGSCRRLICLEDVALAGTLPEPLCRLAARLAGPGPRRRDPSGVGTVRQDRTAVNVAAADNPRQNAFLARSGTALAAWLVRFAQWRVERRHATERRAAFDARERLAHHLAIAGHPDDPA